MLSRLELNSHNSEKQLGKEESRMQPFARGIICELRSSAKDETYDLQ